MAALIVGLVVSASPYAGTPNDSKPAAIETEIPPDSTQLPSIPPREEPEPRVLADEEAQALLESLIAEWYAEAYGISIEEAHQRVRWESEAPWDQLREVAPGRLAAVFAEHEPQWKLVAWFTGGADGLEEAYRMASAAPMPVEVRTGARHTSHELDAIERLVVAELEREPAGGYSTSFADAAAGVVWIFVLSDGDYARDPDGMAARLAGEYDAEFRVRVVEAGPQLDANMPIQRIETQGTYLLTN